MDMSQLCQVCHQVPQEKVFIFEIGSLLSNTLLAIVIVLVMAYLFFTWMKYKRLYNEDKKKKEKNGGKGEEI